ncbi:DinB family protein [Sphingobacterium thalpophilum]
MAWILFHMVEDEIYHRGQISVLLKLLRESEAVS